jgi:hypothetical protein
MKTSALVLLLAVAAVPVSAEPVQPVSARPAGAPVISNLRLARAASADRTPVVRFQIQAVDRASSQGDVWVFFVPTHGRAMLVGQRTELTLSTTSARSVEVPLALPDGFGLRTGRIKVTYSAGRQAASAELRVPW